MKDTYPEKYENIDLYIPDDAAPKWHTGQCYEKEPAVQIKCVLCGNDNFNVAQSDYWTGIKCINCGWETQVHSG